MEKRLVKEVPWEEMASQVRVEKTWFSPDFLAKLKVSATVRCPSGRGYKTFESLVSHLWQKVTQACGVGEEETSQLRIPINVHTHVVPPIAHGYFGNVVLWAFPRATVRELLSQPLDRVAEVVHVAIAQVND
ncbi:hypothetical protein AMTR_s00038p00061180 [Amborella trichopoda]|uniref:Uncharacterized protein n=1 Tax=Amborella trichopoda TaxID=13333 RepID=U5D2G6_AMBTC|nr:hypothetical protein AMTR_s00038p00061180 [Amborella trichopoda]